MSTYVAILLKSKTTLLSRHWKRPSLHDVLPLFSLCRHVIDVRRRVSSYSRIDANVSYFSP